MTKKTLTNIYFKKTLSCLVLCLVILTAASCTQSSEPRVEELVKTNPPTFSGSANISLTTPSIAYDLNGECDTRSYSLEYSYDQSTWTKIPAGCPSGTFTIHLLVSPTKTVYVRSGTKFGFTDASKAFVRFVLPPNSPAFEFVSSGTSINDGDLNVQNTVSHNFVGTPISNATKLLNTGVTGVVYGY